MDRVKVFNSVRLGKERAVKVTGKFIERRMPIALPAFMAKSQVSSFAIGKPSFGFMKMFLQDILRHPVFGSRNRQQYSTVFFAEGFGKGGYPAMPLRASMFSAIGIPPRYLIKCAAR
jgi:hypothetical protein